jgi:hypothetical protein
MGLAGTGRGGAMSAAALRDLTRPLLAWWVGDYDVFAAEDEGQALALANAFGPGLEPFTPDDVCEVSAAELDEPRTDPAGNPWTLRALLLKQTEPGYLAGYEQ